MSLLQKLTDFFNPDGGTLPVDQSLKIDLHSHLLPGIDDGCKTVEESLEVIREIQVSGVTKIITTPHVMSDYYKNTPEIIRGKLKELRDALRENNIQVEIEAAAEYYLDEVFTENIKTGKTELLTFGDKHILFETNMMEKPYMLEQTIFDLKMAGYNPIFAHPERYQYLYSDFSSFEPLFDTGVYFQVNLLSFMNYYSPVIKKAAEFLLERKMIHFVGSDIHKLRHAQAVTHFKKTKKYRELLDLNLLNNSLI